MNKAIPPSLLSDFSLFLTEHLGLSFTKERLPQLIKGLESTCKEFAIADPVSCIHKMMTRELSPKVIDTLTAHLTVGETYFFREKEAFDLLETRILPLLLQKAGQEKRLSMWSAACSTGEEAYSLAITIDTFKSLLRNWQIDIYATDINRKSLEFGKTGIYYEWRLRCTPPWIIDKYFVKKEKKRYEIKPHIKQMVSFEYFNLVKLGEPQFLMKNVGGMDLIFCRNVLMYFTSQTATAVFKKMDHYLCDNGFLIFSPTDILNIPISQPDHLRTLGKAIFYKGNTLPYGFGPAHDTGFPSLAGDEKLTGSKTHKIIPSTSNFPMPHHFQGKKQDHHAPAPQDIETAKNHYQSGRLKAAEEVLINFLKAKPPRPIRQQTQVITLLAQVYADLGKLDKARTWGEKAVSGNPLNTSARYLLAHIHMGLGNRDTSIKLLRECIFLDPDFIPAHFELGMIYHKESNNREATRCFRNALALLTPLEPQAPVPGLAGEMTAGHMINMIQVFDEERIKKKNEQNTSQEATR